MTIKHSALSVLLTLLVLLSSCQHLPPQKTDSETTAQTAEPSKAQPSVETHISSPDAPPVYTDLWQRIRAGYGLPALSDAQTKKQLDWFISYRKYFIGLIPECQPYLHYVVTELAANNIPLELALLPFIESSYNPSARSPGRLSNVGMWQIAPITGKTFGLSQNKWYDGRKDVVASTDAAVRLLNKMYARFDNDWLVAIAAYNAGDGTVQRAINANKRAHKPTDFWSLPLPTSTQNYVRKLVALSKIILHPEDYAFTLPSIPNEPYFVTLAVSKQIDLAQLAKSSDISAQELKKLNAGLNGWLTHPTTPYLLLAPKAKAELIDSALGALPTLAREKLHDHFIEQSDDPSNKTYKVVKGDTLSKIAKNFGVSIQSIATENNINKHQLKIGQVLKIQTME